MFDRRKLKSSGVGSPVYKFKGHDAAVLCVQVAGDSTLYNLIEVLICKSVMDILILCLLTYIFLLFQWSPDKSSVFGSAAEDGILNIWDYEKV